MSLNKIKVIVNERGWSLQQFRRFVDYNEKVGPLKIQFERARDRFYAAGDEFNNRYWDEVVHPAALAYHAAKAEVIDDLYRGRL